ncbi:lanosterol synthase [Pseudozyma hubeiensis SY62]|uniref:Lanosterol synthase n=1 Tax=Pseudozyma hubeiensis (strain SY62) TaxID=1305764 RepID=R9NVJ1_PSEHS|nr:lanosterol synthase [Pseudozyma hubeiensis SY62]GAC92473.1 lanosterol synthase [Pseudozyma hubeiensis SY62]
MLLDSQICLADLPLSSYMSVGRRQETPNGGCQTYGAWLSSLTVLQLSGRVVSQVMHTLCMTLCRAAAGEAYKETDYNNRDNKGVNNKRRSTATYTRRRTRATAERHCAALSKVASLFVPLQLVQSHVGAARFMGYNHSAAPRHCSVLPA